MAVKLTRLTHKIAIQLHLMAESCTICSSRSSRGQAGNFWIKPCINLLAALFACSLLSLILREERRLCACVCEWMYRPYREVTEMVQVKISIIHSCFSPSIIVVMKYKG
jgi:hypothetical protein